MLTADLVRASVRAGRLYVRGVPRRQRAECVALADSLLGAMGAMEGAARDEVVDVLRALVNTPTHQHVAKGLQKLLFDAAEFEVLDGPEPAALRAALFPLAARRRAELTHDQRLNRDSVLATVAEQFSITADQVERSLYADLRGTHVLTQAPKLTGSQLVERYELALEQAVLLRAVQVRLTLMSPHPDLLRQLLRACKFRRLLWRVRTGADDGGSDEWTLEINGPMSVLRSSTRYGLQLALLMPFIRSLGRYRLEAEVLWGRQRRAAVWMREGTGEPSAQSVSLSEPVARFVEDVERLDAGWRAEVCTQLVEVPGDGWCVPDLTLIRDDGQHVLFEVMGYWSRDAVWKRVELARVHLGRPVIFAVSERLRVDEGALPDGLPAALCVYKGVIHARRVLQLADRLVQVVPGAP